MLVFKTRCMLHAAWKQLLIKQSHPKIHFIALWDISIISNDRHQQIVLNVHFKKEVSIIYIFMTTAQTPSADGELWPAAPAVHTFKLSLVMTYVFH